MKKRTSPMLHTKDLYYYVIPAVTVLIFAIAILTPAVDRKLPKIVNKTNKDKSYYLKSAKGTHQTLKSVQNPSIVEWVSRTLKFHMKPQKRLLDCPQKCDFYDLPVILPPNVTGAYVFYGTLIEFDDLPLPRDPDNKIWGLLHEESPKFIPEFLFDKGLKLFNYSATYSRYSDVPFPLQWLPSYSHITDTKYFIPTAEKNSLLPTLAPILYIQTMCSVSTERDLYVQELMKLQKIDSYGKCLNNKKLPYKLTESYLFHLQKDFFLKFIARYKFVLALENGVCDDYLTEKFWRAIQVGVVPIYFGSPTVRDWLPNPKSAILLQDFPTPELLSQHIDLLMKNDSLYEEYLQHKTKGVISNGDILQELKERPYQTSYDEILEKFLCFLCDKLHNMDTIPQNRVITKYHYKCPLPVSVLSQKVNPTNRYIKMLKNIEAKVQETYHRVKTFKGNITG